MDQKRTVKKRSFLKDVLMCSLGAYGGPEAHYGVFTHQMVEKKAYLSEQELAELIALTALLPGPSSSQTIVSIGYKHGGPWLAFLTMLVWSVPVLAIMTLLSFSEAMLSFFNLSMDVLRFIGPMAIGFIMIALTRLGSKILVNRLNQGLFLGSAVFAYFLRFIWMFPLLLLLGGVFALLKSKDKPLWTKVTVKPQWGYLVIFFVLALGTVFLARMNDFIVFTLFEHFYRYGYLVIGGGQVLVPYMYQGLVEILSYLSHEQFVTGYGLVQGLPGPMFSFSAYAGGIAAKDQGTFVQLVAAIVSGIAIFLPGLLLIYFVYPMWEKLKVIKGLKVALKGVTAVACGLILATAIVLVQSTDWSLASMMITGMTFIVLLTKRVPAPIIVVFTLILGFII